jgi:hypothetical protein
MKWNWANVKEEVLGEHGTLGREIKGDVVLVRRVARRLVTLNPGLSADAIDQAIGDLTRDRRGSPRRTKDGLDPCVDESARDAGR